MEAFLTVEFSKRWIHYLECAGNTNRLTVVVSFCANALNSGEVLSASFGVKLSFNLNANATFGCS